MAEGKRSAGVERPPCKFFVCDANPVVTTDVVRVIMGNYYTSQNTTMLMHECIEYWLANT